MAAGDDTEEWRGVPGYPRYEVSSAGKVRRENGSFLTPYRMKSGHYSVCLSHDGYRRTYLLHRIVLLSFIGPCPDGSVTRHMDGNPANNDISNLVWGTQSENMYDVVRHGTHWIAKRDRCKNGHPYVDGNIGWRRADKRHRRCLVCKVEASRRWEAKRLKGFPHGGAWRNRTTICVDDGKIYESATAAARAYSLNRRAVIQVCLGYPGRQTAGGRRFQYLSGPALYESMKR